MVGTVRKHTSSFFLWKEGGAIKQSFTRNDVRIEESFESAKVAGAVVKFPDGSIFRKATNRSRSRSWLELASSQTTRTTRLDYPIGTQGYVDTSPGGYNADYVFTAIGLIDRLGLYTRTSSPTIPQDMRNEAVTKALNKIADQKANLGESLATYQQTLRLLTNPAGSLSNLVKRILDAHRNRKWRKFLRQSARDIERNGVVDSAAAAYIKWVYGVKPLMQDVHGLIELAKDKTLRPLLLNGRGYSERQDQSDPVTNTSLSNVTSSSGTDVRAAVRCSLWAHLDPNNAGSRSLNQLGLLNPLSLAWDLVTWSFVVDWVVPIGPVLSALSAPAGLIFVDGSLSNRITAVAPYTQHWNGYWSPVWRKDTDVPASGTWRYEGYTRQQLTSWPLPGFWVDFDPLRGDRSLKALCLAILGLRSLR
jgi:hypothetical protein